MAVASCSNHAASQSNIETFAVAFETRWGANKLEASVQTAQRTRPPALAVDLLPDDGEDD